MGIFVLNEVFIVDFCFYGGWIVLKEIIIFNLIVILNIFMYGNVEVFYLLLVICDCGKFFKYYV